MINRSRRHIICACTLILISGIAVAERIRGPIVEIITINSAESYVLSVTPRDLIALFVGSDSRIIRGVEIDLTLPTAIAGYRDGFILSVYEQVYPAPTHANMNYSAVESAFVHVRNTSDSRYVVLFGPSASVPDSRVLLKRAAASDRPFILSVEPISKALPESIASESIGISLQGIFADLGILELQIKSSTRASRPFTVEIDGENMAYSAAGYLLPPGAHDLRISADPDFELSKRVDIQRGSTEQVIVNLATPLPTVFIDAPENSLIFLDGQRYRPEVHRFVEIVSGEHIVLIQLGDYAISRRFTVKEGQDYTISLFLDIIIEERR